MLASRTSGYCRIILLFLLFSLPCFSGAARGAGEYTLAVVPQLPPVAMHTNWTPFVERLARETGLNFKLKVYEMMDGFEQDLQDGKPDFIFSSPTQIVLARQSQGYIPLVRSSRKIKGVLFVRKDSSITEVSQLAGKNIAFVGSRNLWSVFVRHGLSVTQPPRITFNSVYSGSTDNVYKSVILGKADAGATLDVDIANVDPEVRALIRPVMTTEEVSPHPLSAHPRIPEEKRRIVSEAVLRLAEDEEGRDLLRTIRMPSPVAADYGRDYQGIEVVDINALIHE